MSLTHTSVNRLVLVGIHFVALVAGPAAVALADLQSATSAFTTSIYANWNPPADAGLPGRRESAGTR